MAAVADGAGSVALADVGSALAAHESVRILSHYLAADKHEPDWERLMRRTFEETLSIVKKEAKDRNCGLHELSTTLILAAATPQMAACMQIGDGAAVVSFQGGDILTLSAPQQGECLNQTIFLTSSDALESSKFSLQKGKVVFMSLFSDGLQQLALTLPGYTPHQPFFTPLQQFVMNRNTGECLDTHEQLSRFLDSPRVNERTDDDKTLVLAALIEK